MSKLVTASYNTIQVIHKHMTLTSKFDVIFCRNVMIYFDDDMRKQCLDIFSKQLDDDGTLFIGHSETIINRDLFTPRAEPQSFAYVKSQREFGRVA